MRSFDTMVIPKGTPNRSAVAKWMNYLYDPSNAARVTRSIQYISPVLGVQVALERSGADGDQPVPVVETLRRRDPGAHVHVGRHDGG